MCVCVFVCVCVCVPRGYAGTLVVLGGPTVLIDRAQRAGGRVCVCVCAIGGHNASAVGVTWTSRTPKASWTARYGHTSVIDAAGAIYVLGGYDGKYLADVWVSTDGGEGPTRRLLGVLEEYLWVLRGH